MGKYSANYRYMFTEGYKVPPEKTQSHLKG